MKREHLLLLLIVLLSFFLRIYHVALNPPSLYWDEASLGYNAYAIATAGIDEHGERLPIARFIAFGDYKPPGYIYAAALFIKFFGVNEAIIRLPSALAGVGLVLMAYHLSFLLLNNRVVGYLSALSVAVSPWSIQLSRGAFEANLAAFFNAAGIYCFLLGVKKRSLFLPLSVAFFVASFYTFNANRIIAPLFILILTIIHSRELRQRKQAFVIALIVGMILVAPSISFLRSPESRLRFHEVSIFTDLSIIEEANAKIAQDAWSFTARLIHNRRVLFFREYVRNFADHFNPRYLFISGDVNPRLSSQDVGELYLYELPFLLTGFFILLKRKKDVFLISIIWIIVAIIPAATARETPHALRTVSLLPVYQLIIGYGLHTLWQGLKGKKNYPVLALLLFITAGSLFYHLHYYHIHYPRDWAGEWQDGYKQMVAEISEIEDNYDSIIVSEHRGRPYIYLLLYKKVNPHQYVAERRGGRDVVGFYKVEGFGKYFFGSEFRDVLYGKVLFVSSPGEIRLQDKVLKKVYSRDGQVAFVIAEI